MTVTTAKVLALVLFIALAALILRVTRVEWQKWVHNYICLIKLTYNRDTFREIRLHINEGARTFREGYWIQGGYTIVRWVGMPLMPLWLLIVLPFAITYAAYRK